MPTTIEGWGLGHINHLSQAPCKFGMLFCDGELLGDVAFAYKPEIQEWNQIGEDLSVGFYLDNRPTPKERLRDDALAGHFVPLGDDNEWLVPVARSWNSVDPPVQSIALPSALALDYESKKWEATKIVPRYARLWEICEKFSDYQMSEVTKAIESDEDKKGDKRHEVALTLQDAVPLACEVLTYNYNITETEISALGLMQSNVGPIEILLALIDQPTFDLLFQKKTGSSRDGSNSSDGKVD